MKVLGIVSEYNPFHNGHLHHLKASKALSGANCTVAVMSGNFTQRGEPALVDKWARTEMALLCGIDLVIELPFIYAMSSAEYFAFGAVKLLDSLGVVNMMSFGSESGSLEKLSETASILSEEPEHFKHMLKESLSRGKSYPAARQEALSSYLVAKYNHDSLSDILKNSNNILAVEYLKALKQLSSNIIPMTIERVGNKYNSVELSDELSSATSIRKIVAENSWSDARQLLAAALPNQSLAILEREIELGRGPVFPSDFGMLLFSLLRRMSAEEINSLPYMEQGLENRFKQAGESTGSYEDLLGALCTRRYTNTRMQRILFCLLTGLHKSKFDFFNQNGGPAYIRVLGFNETGRKLLSEIKDKAGLPVITKAANFKSSDLPRVSDMLQMEAAASDQYVLGFKNTALRKSGSEFTRNVICFSS